MKKFILRCLIWLAVAFFGSLIVLRLNGVTDLKQLDIASMMFGCFVGLMASYMNVIMPEKNTN